LIFHVIRNQSHFTVRNAPWKHSSIDSSTGPDRYKSGKGELLANKQSAQKNDAPKSGKWSRSEMHSEYGRDLPSKHPKKLGKPRKNTALL
jgi:hypothetical protein